MRQRKAQRKQDRTASAQSLTQATAQAVIEATKVAIMTVAETEIPVNTTRPTLPGMKQVIQC